MSLRRNRYYEEGKETGIESRLDQAEGLKLGLFQSTPCKEEKKGQEARVEISGLESKITKRLPKGGGERPAGHLILIEGKCFFGGGRRVEHDLREEEQKKEKGNVPAREVV